MTQDIPKIQIGGGKKRRIPLPSYKDNFKEILTLIKTEGKETIVTPIFAIAVNGKNIPLTQFPEQIIIKHDCWNA